MQIITFAMSGLALLASIIFLAMYGLEKKRSQKRNAAMLDFITATVNSAIQSSGFDSRIQKLEQGITPDYEQAKAAANAVNDFNRGITNILGFDPVSALKKEQQRERLGGDVE